MASYEQIIGKVNPWLYAKNGKELLAKYKTPENIPADEVTPEPWSNHEFTYDSSSETLEPVYFYILDLMNDMGFITEKISDNFTSSPGSGHFAELGQRATIMQQQGTKILGDINTVLRSVLNIIYDLKEFRVRLQSYSDLRTDKKEAATLSLKQLWMDKVDISKGNSSIKAMALGQAGFQTLIDAFLFVKDESLKGPDKKEIDLNDRVKRILRARILEFNDWVVNSEKELRKRYELEKSYLKSQVNSLNLYSRWAKPYLRAAKDLEMKTHGSKAALVTAFNTIILELTLFGRKKVDTRDKVASGALPKEFENLKTRDYYNCILVDFTFRGIPSRVGQQAHYSFGGRAEISFKSYGLNEEEWKKVEEEYAKSEDGDVLALIEGATGENLKHIQDEINFFIEDKDVIEEELPKDTSNPFKALFGFFEPKQEIQKRETKKPKQPVIVRSESYAEKEYLRVLSLEDARKSAAKIFETYKKGHGMPAFSSQ